MTSYRILVFSWNTQSIGLCETLNDQEAMENRNSYSSVIPGITTWQYSCQVPDFYFRLSELIKEKDPDLVVIGLQEDRHPGSYFHSHLLPEEMPKIGYQLVKRCKMMGVGSTTYKGLFKGDLFKRGLRLSVYSKSELLPKIEAEEFEMRSVMGNDGTAEYTCSTLLRNKGAIAAYINLPDYGRIAILCCHLPFNSQSLIASKETGNLMYRQTEVNNCNYYFNKIIEELTMKLKPAPVHTIMFGDLNYRISGFLSAHQLAFDFNLNENNPEFLSQIYNTSDELKQQIVRGNIYGLQEGVNNTGPMFAPTCKMQIGRTSNVYKTGKFDQRMPSWCDRILYGKFPNTRGEISCTYYDRFDHGTVMSKSDHAAVVGVYELK